MFTLVGITLTTLAAVAAPKAGTVSEGYDIGDVSITGNGWMPVGAELTNSSLLSAVAACGADAAD
ncbi:hypothetical protein D3C85_1566370 [compost metagenome]